MLQNYLYEGLVRRCEVVLKETCGRVRVGKELGEKFWTTIGVRQGCPLSPLLFVLFFVDLGEELEKGTFGITWQEEGILVSLCGRRGVIS